MLDDMLVEWPLAYVSSWEMMGIPYVYKAALMEGRMERIGLKDLCLKVVEYEWFLKSSLSYDEYFVFYKLKFILFYLFLL